MRDKKERQADDDDPIGPTEQDAREPTIDEVFENLDRRQLTMVLERDIPRLSDNGLRILILLMREVLLICEASSALHQLRAGSKITSHFFS